MEERIYGLETEYGLIKRHTDHIRIGMDDGKLDAYPELMLSYVPGAFFCDKRHIWTTAGWRMYIDTGNHFEAATPECRTPYDLTCYYTAGNSIVRTLCAKVNHELACKYMPYRIAAMADNIHRDRELSDVMQTEQHEKITWGLHESYLFETSGYCSNFNFFTSLLVPFIATRNVTWCGSGQLGRTHVDKLAFLISQRAETIKHPISYQTTNNRGIINTRKEHHVSRKNFGRLHLISSDTIRSECIVWLRAAVTGLILRMAEEAVLPSLPWKSNICASYLRANRDTTLLQPIWRIGDKWMTALDIQRVFFNAAERHFNGSRNTIVTQHILAEWNRILALLEQAPDMESCEVEWIVKLRYLEQYARAKFGKELSVIKKEEEQYRLIQAEMAYHIIGGANTLYEHLVKKGLLRTLVSPEDVADARIRPPHNTRARARSDCITFLVNQKPAVKRNDVCINWSEILVRRKNGQTKEMLRFPLPLFESRVPPELMAQLRILQKCRKAAAVRRKKKRKRKGHKKNRT